MSRTTDLGRRIELVSMDPHFHNISIALYRQKTGQGAVFLVHSYSGKEGTQQRIEFVASAMTVLGGMETLPREPQKLRFPCQVEHRLACRRVFLEACKLDPNAPLEARPLSILDKKSSRTISLSYQGEGTYRLTADGEETDKAGRISAVAGGLMKLGEMQTVDAAGDRVAFSCGQPHHALVGLLLIRALNVRAVFRELEMAASRGVLSAPSAQK